MTFDRRLADISGPVVQG